MNNCRNCKFADWHKNAAGRKCFGNWAKCVAPLPDTSKWPASIRGVSFNETRPVASNDNIDLKCPTWEKEIKS